MKYWSEDTVAILLGAIILIVGLVAFLVLGDAGEGFRETLFNIAGSSRPSRWDVNPLSAFSISWLLYAAALLIVLLVMFGTGSLLLQRRFRDFAPGFFAVFLIATLAYLLAGQSDFRSMGLGYALWAIALGLFISNVFGIPAFIRPALSPELFIKTGLVLLGAEVLFGKILAIGLPGIFVAWVVTPIVLVTTYWFGQRILKISSRTLNITISADMSVCGVSAAIATAAACRASREELTTAVGLSMVFTSIMMVVMPAVIKSLGMPEVLGGAWIGGTIDATGAVVAAGAFLGDTALNVAATIKMIQNILIGVIAFAVAVYWSTVVDQTGGQRVSAAEIWIRFPKFVLGFVAASLVFSGLHELLDAGTATDLVENGVLEFSSDMRGWLFCLAFVSIGMSANFRELRSQFAGGKALILYLCGQALNLCLTLLMAWIMFYKVFPDITNSL